MVALVAFVLILMLSMGVLCVDVGNLAFHKTKLQASADAAALAGATSLAMSSSNQTVLSESTAYAQLNSPSAEIQVTLGVWDPEQKRFTEDSANPNAVRVTLKRSESHGNPVRSMFSGMFGKEMFDLEAQSVAVGATPQPNSSGNVNSVYVTSTKDLSNVVLEFEDGSHQKFEGLSSYSGTFSGTGEHAEKEIVGVWVKSGCYQSKDGSGYGEYLPMAEPGMTVHGNTKNKGCYAHVTATFESTGLEFADSGSHGPVRIVK
jgi:Flp pilus assembly protein TadG